MADSKSSGLMGLSHYRNSRASVDMFEPLYKSHFVMNMALPAGVGSSTENTNLCLEGVTKVNGLDSHKFPELVTQTYKWAQRRFVGGKPTETTMDLSLDIEVNLKDESGVPSAYIIKTLRKWCDLAYDCRTGRGGKKVDYTAPWMTIQAHDRDVKSYWIWKCYDVFPMSKIPPLDLDYNENGIFKISGWKIAVDHFDEIIY